MTSSDRFPVPVRSAVKSNLTDWCFQNLSKRVPVPAVDRRGRDRQMDGHSTVLCGPHDRLTKTDVSVCLPCFDAVSWATVRASGL